MRMRMNMGRDREPESQNGKHDVSRGKEQKGEPDK
jgi:hypothetical protein